MWVTNIPQCGKAFTKRVYIIENYKVVMTTMERQRMVLISILSGPYIQDQQLCIKNYMPVDYKLEPSDKETVT